MLKNLQKIGLKFFVEKPCSIDVREFVPIFHSWIQNSTLKDLMIDVADYAHVETGPGVVLIAHEANYAMDLGENRLGLLYYRKQPIESDFPAILRSSFSSALHACRLLETDNKLQGRLQFRSNEILFISNDRLLAPNTDEAFSCLSPMIAQFMAKLFAGKEVTLNWDRDPKQRLMISIRTSEMMSTDVLLKNLA